ncbi:unnamed protein product, partial [marine sediment metagenome]
ILMAEKEDAEVLKALLPVVGIGTAVIVIGTLLVRVFVLGRRVYQDGQYLVPVRYGQLHDIRDFVQPANPDVIAAYSQIGPDPWRLYDFVCRNIDYRGDIGEFWAFPSEVLAWEAADCEDTSNLLTSLLRCGGINAYTVIGDYLGYGHAWVDRGGQIYETTYTRAQPVPDPEHYIPYVLFDDISVIELWPGALGEIFSLRRDEATKLALVASALEAEALA